MAEQKQVTARVLVDTEIGGQPCNCNDVVKYNEPELKSLAKEGAVDISKASVDYALGEGAEVRELGGIGDAGPTVDEIVAAIGLLDADDNSLWVSQGVPNVTALETVLDAPVTAAARDEAVAVIAAQDK